jgi:hypothetical protein
MQVQGRGRGGGRGRGYRPMRGRGGNARGGRGAGSRSGDRRLNGGQAEPAQGKRGAGSSTGIDFRWKKKKKVADDDEEGTGTTARNEEGRFPSADALQDGDRDENVGCEIRTVPQELAGGDGSALTGTGDAKSGLAERQKERLLAVKVKRRRKFEEDRERADKYMRSDPAAFLWEQYTAWAGDKLSPLEQDIDRWSSDDAFSILTNDADDDGSLIRGVKHVVAEPYSAKDASPDGVPGVCVLLVASSGLRAAHLSKAMYDGKPVGKLFSKHIKKEDQIIWLQKFASPSPARTAVGTARRLHVLCDDGSLSLAQCTAFVIDMKRDAKTQNVLDMSATRDELFDFIHVHLRPLVRSKRVKILLHVPAVNPVGVD